MRSQVSRNQGSATKTRKLRTLLLAAMEEAVRNNPEGVGRRIAQARREMGLTQDELADLVGVKMCQIQYYEAGQSNPYRKIREIAEATGKSVGWLMHGDTITEAAAEEVASQLEGLGRHQEELAATIRDIAAGQVEILAAIENARAQVLAVLEPPPARPKRTRT